MNPLTTAAVELVQTALAQGYENAPIRMGTIQGGWEYVWFSFGITWATLLLYGFSLWVRRPQHAKDGT